MYNLKKIACVEGIVEGIISKNQKEKMDLDMIQYLFLKNKNKTFAEISPKKKYKIDHRFLAFKKIKKFL